MTKTKPVAVVAGVGPGLGASLCRKLSGAEYAVAGIARSSDFGSQLAAELRQSGRPMCFYACDTSSRSAIEATFSRIEEELGVAEVLIYSAGQFLQASVVDTRLEDFRNLWELNCLGAFLCARRAVPGMLSKGEGTIILTGATASVRAASQFAAFGSAKFALRGLAQSMARELAPRGIHVAHAVIDGVIWTARTREIPGIAKEKCLDPDAIAEVYLSVVRQDRSAWIHEFDIRPYIEPF